MLTNVKVFTNNVQRRSHGATTADVLKRLSSPPPIVWAPCSTNERTNPLLSSHRPTVPFIPSTAVWRVALSTEPSAEASLKISATDIEVLKEELEVSSEEAKTALLQGNGDVVQALRKLLR